MALVLDGTTEKVQTTSGNRLVRYDLTYKATLATGIVISGTTPTWTYPLSNYWSPVPTDIIAVILRVRYIHSGSTNHGYLEFNSYQQGFNSNYATYQASHYDWYYNTTNEFIHVPWNGTNAGNDTLVLQVTSSYNSSGSNNYNIYVDGLIRGA